MKKIFLSLALITLSAFFPQSANAMVFDFEFIADNATTDPNRFVGNFALSNSRNIAWRERVNLSGGFKRHRIFLRSGGSTTVVRDVISGNSSVFFEIQVNDLGEVFWRERNTSGLLELNRYSSGAVTTIATGSSSTGPSNLKINNNGKAAYSLPTAASPTSTRNIYYFDGTNSTAIGSDSLQQPAAHLTDTDVLYFVTRTLDQNILTSYSGGTQTVIGDLGKNFFAFVSDFNDSGQSVWREQVGGDTDVLGFDGTKVAPLTINSQFDEFSPMINNAGQIVWRSFNKNVPLDNAIHYFDGSTVRRLPRGADLLLIPFLTERGEVIWTENLGGDNELFYFDGITVQQITDNTSNDTVFHANGFGDIIALRGDAWYLGKNTVDLPLAVRSGGFPFAATPIPEPTTMALMGLGLAGAGWMRRKKRRI